jgi:adenylate cyclase
MSRQNESKTPTMSFNNILQIICIGSIGGIGVAFLSTHDYSLSMALSGIAIGLWITILILYGETTFLKKIRHLQFAYFFLIKTAYYTVVILLVMALFFLFRYLTGDKVDLPAHRIIAILLGSFSVGAFSNFTTMLRRMLGQNVMFSFFTGRYHKPVREDRIFMFLDIASSTTIAEKIGDLNFHIFLNDFYYDTSEAIVAFQGEIYKYVGDEVIVTWKNPAGFDDERCIRCFFAIQKAIAERSGYYLGKFGFVPQFRSGIHFGPVVVGEMGDLKMEIAFLGDTVNTTARVQEACKVYNKALIVSGEVLSHLNLSREFVATRLDETQLRGRETLSTLFSIEKNKGIESRPPLC